MLIFGSFYSSKNHERNNSLIKLTVLNIDNNNNNNCFLSSKLYIFSKRSCDTENWSNAAENSALITEINYILKYVQIENSCFY